MPRVSPIRTIFPIRRGAGSVNRLAQRMVWSYHSQGNGLNGVKHDCGSWFFVLVTLSPQMWEHCRPSSPSSAILLLCHLGLGQGVEHDCGCWFFVLVTLSPTDVGVLSAQLTQLCDLAPLSFGPLSFGPQSLNLQNFESVTPAQVNVRCDDIRN